MGNYLRGVDTRLFGLLLLASGLLLFLAAGLFYGYKAYASTKSDALNVSVPTGSDTQASSLSNNTLAARYQAALPGSDVSPKYWSNPLWTGSDVRQSDGLPEGFRRADSYIPEAHIRADRIAIPSIGVASEIRELAVIDLGDSQAYETPKFVVGHIPETPNAGEQGNGWYFGHLESPIQGEGNVFRSLPRLAEQLRRYVQTGEDPVYVTLSSGEREFLYQVVSTEIVHRDDLRLYDSDATTITLVTCYPRWVYDQRVLVTAKLVGVKG
ncbi:MAG: sortase [Chloroflexi bacterium]|nr:sortase [Chloroflexota bacterium]